MEGKTMCRKNIQTYWCVTLSLLALSFLAGCNKTDANRAAVRGEVKLDGRPLERGTILFSPAEGVKGTAAGTEIIAGHYQLPAKAGASLGLNRVEIRSPRKTGRTIPRPFPRNSEMMEEAVEGIASRFNSETTLSHEVKSGENTADFEVSSTPDAKKG
jgi:hypothetical protein